jgi:putative ABC transport system permease protein
LLARGARRANEFAVRSALGASQGRIVRQLLTESLVISVAGGALGIVLAYWGSKALVALAPAFLLKTAPGLAGGPVSSQVLAFSLATVLLTTVFFGLAPAIQSARPHITETLKETGRSSLQSPRNRRFRSALVVSEIALAMVLLIGAGLMVRTLIQLGHVSLGFNPANVLTLRVALTGEWYVTPQARAQFWERVVADVESLPGVESASVSRGLPVHGWAGQGFVTAEQPNPPAGENPIANYVIAGPHYFRTLQIPIRSGRSFNEHDTKSGNSVVIVNEELARTYWPGQDALGKQLRVGFGEQMGPWRTIVGVAENILSRGPDEGFHPELYIPVQQFPWLLGGPKHLFVPTSSGVRPESVMQPSCRKSTASTKTSPSRTPPRWDGLRGSS